MQRKSDDSRRRMKDKGANYPLSSSSIISNSDAPAAKQTRDLNRSIV